MASTTRKRSRQRVSLARESDHRVVHPQMSIVVHQHTNTPRNRPIQDLRVVLRPSYYVPHSEAAPGAPELAASVEKLIARHGETLYQDPDRGLDHGAYVPLVEMYPDADIPVLQVSMPTLDPAELIELGRKLAPLREEGVLIVGSGFSTHNLSEMNLGAPDTDAPPTWSSEFDHWLDETLSAGDLDALIDFQHKAPAASLAHPRTEHFAPLFVALGTAIDESLDVESVIDGFWHGLSKRSVQIA